MQPHHQWGAMGKLFDMDIRYRSSQFGSHANEWMANGEECWWAIEAAIIITRREFLYVMHTFQVYCCWNARLAKKIINILWEHQKFVCTISLTNRITARSLAMRMWTNEYFPSVASHRSPEFAVVADKQAHKLKRQPFTADCLRMWKKIKSGNQEPCLSNMKNKANVSKQKRFLWGPQKCGGLGPPGPP